MSGLYVGADLHVRGNHRILGGPFVNGRNRRCDETVAVLGAVAKFVDDRGGCLLLAGDVFDVSGPTPQVVTAVMEAVSSLTGDPERVGFIPMAGNHDRVSATPGDHALGPLGRLPGVVAVDQPRLLEVGTLAVMCVPPAPKGVPFADHLEQSLLCIRADVLCIHAGVEDGNTEHFLRGSDQAIDVIRLAAIAKGRGITEVYAGDWHTHRRWGVDGVRIVQLGALVPTGWDNMGPKYGQVAEAGTDRVWTFPGPRFFDATSEQDAERLLRREFKNGKMRDINYVRLEVPRADQEAVDARLQAIADEVGAHVIVNTSPRDETKVDVRQKVFGGVDAAMDEVVAGMGLGDEDRAAVLARSRQYYATR